MHSTCKAYRSPVAWALLSACFVLSQLVCASAQKQGTYIPPVPSVNGFDPTRTDVLMEINEDNRQRKLLESLSASVSKLDLKAPRAARLEYDKGTQLLTK